MSGKVTDEEMAEFMRGLEAGARADMIPKMRGSLFCMTILNGEPDVKLALEVGMALLLDKPLFVIAIGDMWIPPRVRQIADVVIEGGTFDRAMRNRVQAAIEKFMHDRGIKH